MGQRDKGLEGTVCDGERREHLRGVTGGVGGVYRGMSGEGGGQKGKEQRTM